MQTIPHDDLPHKALDAIMKEATNWRLVYYVTDDDGNDHGHFLTSNWREVDHIMWQGDIAIEAERMRARLDADEDDDSDDDE